MDNFFKIKPASGTYYIPRYTKSVAFVISQTCYKYQLKCAYFD